MFKGEKELFKGLYIYEQPYDWRPYPIIRLAMNKVSASTCEEFGENVCMELDWLAREQGITLSANRPAAKFKELIQTLSAGGEKVVILIDEYDKPILDNILDRDEVLKIRAMLKQFHGMVKAMEENIRFSFITGVSKFTQVSIFSDLNSLDDMTLMPEYATICGFTQEECEHYFAEWIDENAVKHDLAKEVCLDKLRRIYNGLRFSKRPVTVYNPVSFTKAMDQGGFDHYWFETGTPAFLLKLLRERDYPVVDFEGVRLTAGLFSSYEVDDLRVEPLLYQTGYLTIRDYDETTGMYTLGYPNDEVKQSFVERLTDYFTPVPKERTPNLLDHLRQALLGHDLDGAFEVLKTFYARVDYSIKLKHEKYYQTIFYILFILLGYHIRVEENTNKGRMDAVVETKARIYIFEFKLSMCAKAALEQIKRKVYYQKYTMDKRPMTLVGVSFNQETGEIAEWKTEEM